MADDNNPQDKPRGFHPARPTKLSLEDLQALKNLFAEHPRIKWAIYLAGFGGLLDGIHVLWEFIRPFIKH